MMNVSEPTLSGYGEWVMIEAEEQLLAQIVDLFATHFDRKAILRGGMVLRVLGSPRYTNDLDYVFVPYASKKDIVDQLLNCLSQLPEVQLKHSLNSKCLRIVVSNPSAMIQIEAKVARSMPVTTLSTRLLATKYGLPQRLISAMALSVALSHKLAAWNERRLMRDLYDVWFFLQMNVLPDVATLEQRLSKPVYSRLVKAQDQFDGRGVSDFYDFIRDTVSTYTDQDVSCGLSEYLPKNEREGLLPLIQAALVKLK